MKQLIVIVLSVCTLVLHAQTYQWNNKNGGNWTVPENWQPYRVSPSPTDILIIELKQGNELVIDHIPDQTIGKLDIRVGNNGNNKTLTLIPENQIGILTVQGAYDPTILYDFYVEDANMHVNAENIDLVLGANTISRNVGVLRINNLILQH